MLRRSFAVLLLVLLLLTAGCGQRKETLQDGYYTAQAAEYNNGWIEFVTICVSNGELVSVEYNAKNASGYIKSWDIAYMRNMNRIMGTYPNQYTRTYAADFLADGNAQVTGIAGASSSHNTFQQLAAQTLINAKNGDTSVTIVQIQ